MRPIVRSVTPFAFSLLVAALLAVGCSSPKNEQAAQAGGAHFGSNYEIVVSKTPAAPDQPPALDGDSLVVTVGYTGGCETHDFALRHRTRSDTARLRLAHDAHGDDCSERILDDVRVKVPAEALQASTVVLMNPQGGEPFVLRWNGE